MAEWNNDLILEFLELYQREPIIYDPKHPGHKNKIKVNDAWVRIKRALSVEFQVGEIKKKKDSLMAAFRHHMKKQKASIKSGASLDEIYKPSWFAYEFMEAFLGSIYECNSTYNSESVDLPDEGEIDQEISRNVTKASGSNSDVSQTSPPIPQRTPSSYSARRNKQPQELQEAKRQMDQAFSILKDMSKKDCDDECDLYGKLIAKKLRKVQESDREQLMYEIDGLFLKRKKKYPLQCYSGYSSSSQASPSGTFSPVEIQILSPTPSTVLPEGQSAITQDFPNVTTFESTNIINQSYASADCDTI